MARYLFSARNAKGKIVDSFIEAPSAMLALAMLRKKEYVEIRFHPGTRSVAASPTKPPQNASARHAKNIIHFQQRPGLFFLLRTWLAANVLMLSALCVSLLAGWWMQWYIAAALVASALLIIMVVSVVRSLDVIRYDHLLRAYAFGEWAQVKRLCKKLEGKMRGDAGAFDVALHAAVADAALGDALASRASLEPWREKFASSAPALFCARSAEVYWHMGDYPRFLDNMRQAASLSASDAAAMIDEAMAEVRFGELSRATQIFSFLQPELLPVTALPWVDWLKGLIEMEHNPASAVAMLRRALDGMLQAGQTPAGWTSIAIATGDLGVALARAGKVQQARQVVRSAWPVLKHHAPKPMLAELRTLLQRKANLGVSRSLKHAQKD
ncbi:MAG: hypothetical protein P1U67_06085 [Alcanivoracaceae bacterium]|nr:hypothetical protein [Alcanivoracaceae bacterium]